jgi:hypothetical protein
MNVDDLLAYLALDVSHVLTAPLTDWMNASPRFAAFVEMHRDKIRKKIRVEPEAEGLRDLLVELETAYLLLQERRFEIAYETYTGDKRRGTDFAVTYRTNQIFNVEVTRMRAATPDREDRLIDVVCSKLGQMMPNMINVLMIFAGGDGATLDVASTMKRLKARAERSEAGLFMRFNFRDTPDFFKYFTRLSAIFVRIKNSDNTSQHRMLWENPQAKQPLPSAIRAKLQSYG